MTDEQVIEKLARRMGYTPADIGTISGVRCVIWWNAPSGGHVSNHELNSWIKSRDALAPVLVGLSEDEQRRFDIIIWDKKWRNGGGPLLRAAAWLLTLPPRELAHAIAEVLP